MTDFMTPAEVAQMLRVSTKTLTRWAATHPTFPVVKIGGIVRYRREHLLAWVERQQPVAARRSQKRSAA